LHWDTLEVPHPVSPRAINAPSITLQ
jgi:hypothetical protein